MPRTAAPAQLRLISGRGHGRDSGGRKVPQTANFKRVPPKPPTWLSREAAAEWRRVAPELTRLDLLKAEDRAAFTAYCETWAVFVEATRIVKAEGLTFEARQGMLPRPEVAIARAAGRELRAWAAEFGLTPSAEQKVGKQESGGSGEDPFD